MPFYKLLWKVDEF
jgi:hypothetical protein